MVIVGQEVSNFEVTQIGVSQGLLLGNFLFVISMNGFTFNRHCLSTLYADDTTVSTSSKNIEDLLRKENIAMQIACE